MVVGGGLVNTSHYKHLVVENKAMAEGKKAGGAEGRAARVGRAFTFCAKMSDPVRPRQDPVRPRHHYSRQVPRQTPSDPVRPRQVPRQTPSDPVRFGSFPIVN